MSKELRPSYRGVAPGTRLNGIYEIDQMIGAGGMGEVYKSHEIQTGAPVAIKMLLPDMADNEAALALFRREAAALHNLVHDAIVRYFLFSVDPALQRPYLAMEFVDGVSLSDVLASGPLAFEALVKLMRRIASGLHAAHERGIVHRDVSPDNIIVPLSDVTRAKIIDFGIARSTQFGGDKTIIGTGFAGKDNYVSPEQVGLFGGEVTAKSDIYSLGLLLFYALTGQKLDMAGSQFQLVEKRRRVPDLGGVDMRIRPLLEKMLQPDPESRPSTMAEIANWLNAPADRQEIKPPASAQSPPTLRSTRDAAPKANDRPIWLLPAAAAILASLTVGGIYAFYSFVWSAPLAATSQPLPRLGQKADAAAVPASKTSPIPGPAQPAALASGDARGRADRVRRYIEQYDGGDCFFVLPVAFSSNAAVIEGFGAAMAPFEALDRAFKREMGFEASIGVRQVAQAQCPAVKFLGQFGANQARAPRINLSSVEVQNGETLSGTIDNFANRVVDLLLVSDGGQVQNVSYLLKPGTDSLSFSMEIRRNSGGSGPQLVMAVATPQVLESLRKPNPTSADTFFLEALSEARRTNVAVATSARYFRLRN
jgi:serine/threonine protein kinase